MKLKAILTGMAIMIFLISCAIKKTNINQGGKVMKTNKQKVMELLKSIETEAIEPMGYVNSGKYIQHNQNVADGLSGFGALLAQLPKDSAKVNTVRIFEYGDFVFTHTDYDFFGPKIGFDIFRFEDGLIVEHWDNLQEKVEKTASGHSQIDGYLEIKDINRTVENKLFIENFINDILMGANPDKITDYISTEGYIQHNPGVKDGLAGLGEALQSLADAGMPMVYEKNHKILGEGNFILAVSEGVFLKEKVAFYDLFRIESGKIVEHWDTIEKIISDSEAKNSNGKFNF